MSRCDVIALVPEFLVRSVAYSVVATDLEGNYLFVNEVFKKRFSFICDDFIGKPSLIAVAPEDHSVCLHAVEQCLTDSEKVVQVYLRKPDTHSNNFFWTSWEFSVLKDAQKRPVGILCIGHDITETERASRSAKEFDQKVETIIEKITDGFYQLDREWRFTIVNRVAEQMLGLPRAQLIGRRFWDLFPERPNINYPAAFRKAMEQGLTVSFEEYYSDWDKWLNTVVYPSVEGITVFFRDITQEKQRQIALQLSENKLKAILDSTTDSNLLISPERKIINFNKAAYEIALQYFGKELHIGEDITSFLPPESQETFNRYFPQALQGQTHTVEIQRQLDGNPVWFETTYMPVFDNNHQLIGVATNTKNINAKKQAELRLHEQDYVLRAIYQSTSEAIAFLDKDFVIRYHNRVARNITEKIVGKQATVGDCSLDYFLPPCRQEFENYYRRALKGEQIHVELQDDKRRWWRFRTYPVYNETRQEIIGIANTIQDITERKEKELQLRESELRLQKIIEAIPHPLLILDEQVIVQYVNEEFTNVFGYAEQEIIGQSVETLIPERFRAGHATLYQSYLQNGGGFIRRMGRFLNALTKSGKEIVIDASLNTFTIGNRQSIIVILQDVTELKRQQDTILKQNETLRAISWQQSHEIRRPVANILGLCDLLKNYKNETEEMKNLYVDYMLQAAQELDAIIHNIIRKADEADSIADER